MHRSWKRARSAIQLQRFRGLSLLVLAPHSPCRGRQPAATHGMENATPLQASATRRPVSAPMAVLLQLTPGAPSTLHGAFIEGPMARNGVICTTSAFLCQRKSWPPTLRTASRREDPRSPARPHRSSGVLSNCLASISSLHPLLPGASLRPQLRFKARSGHVGATSLVCPGSWLGEWRYKRRRRNTTKRQPAGSPVRRHASEPRPPFGLIGSPQTLRLPDERRARRITRTRLTRRTRR